MQLSAIFILALISLANAAAVKRTSSCTVKGPIVLPESGVSPELPAPAANLTLKHIALGHGYQNYTCLSLSTPSTATGALALLYDVLPLYPNQSRSSLPSLSAFYNLASITLNTITPLNLAVTTAENSSTNAGRISLAAPSVNTANPFPINPSSLSLPGLAPLPAIGVHFFSESGTPTFKFATEHLSAAKTAAHAAPVNAGTGPNGEAAVPWLYLTNAGGSEGISVVYRVETVGGSGHICDGVGSDSSVYTAFYFFYGPKA